MTTDIVCYEHKARGRNSSPFSGLVIPHKRQNPTSSPLVRNDSNLVPYALYFSGGVLSSSVRWLLTPLDSVKCLMQIHPKSYPSLSAGLARLYQEGSLYRGFVPTVLSYSTQTGTKYMMYELFKAQAPAAPENDVFFDSAVYVASAACAEAIADVLMCPWEMLKVRMQTNHDTPKGMVPALQTMIQRRRDLGFPFGSLQPLWSRQITGTVLNFLTFEHSVKAIYSHILQKPKNECLTSTQLFVTVIAGYTSGLVSTVFSHPADSLISYKGRYPHKTTRELIAEIGWRQLATQGLGPRVFMTGSIIGFQWFIYDGFKTAMGMGTTGG